MTQNTSREEIRERWHDQYSFWKQHGLTEFHGRNGYAEFWLAEIEKAEKRGRDEILIYHVPVQKAISEETAYSAGRASVVESLINRRPQFVWDNGQCSRCGYFPDEETYHKCGIEYDLITELLGNFPPKDHE